MENALSLYELTHAIQQTIMRALPATYWVRAEISEGRQNANGHYYCKFIEKNEAGQDIASASGIIWAGVYLQLKARFERETGQVFAAGIKVLVNVRVNFHERYGLSLQVCNIDPSYTIGDMVRRRKMILAQLAKEGVVEMNRQLELPRPLLRIAVITSENAAGYGDFRNQLATSGARFAFVTKLFPAMMQGNKVEETVIAALNCIAAESDRWDAVVIIRGGGAVSDLNGFESYNLASNVAQFMLPVITGIGHERDETVIDLVANTKCKTPTAVADFLVAKAQEEERMADALAMRLHNVSVKMISGQKERLANVSSAIVPWFTHVCHTAQMQFSRLLLRLPRGVNNICLREDSRNQRLAYKLETVAVNATRMQYSEIERKTMRLARGIEQFLRTQHVRVDAAEKNIRLAGPERVFKMGFSLTTLNGKAVTDASQLKPGDRITTHFAKGSVESSVEKVN